MNGSGRGGVKRNVVALFDCGFNLRKDRFLFCEWVTSLEGCNVVNSSCKYFLVWWLLDGCVECWAEVFWTDVVWVLWVCFDPPAKLWFSKYSSVGSDPTFWSPEKSNPMIGVIYLNEFSGCMTFVWEINVVSVIIVSWSLVFKVSVLFDMCWEIVLLSPVNSFIFVSEFSDKDYCRQGVTDVCPMFQGQSRKAWLMLRSIEP